MTSILSEKRPGIRVPNFVYFEPSGAFRSATYDQRGFRVGNRMGQLPRDRSDFVVVYNNEFTKEAMGGLFGLLTSGVPAVFGPKASGDEMVWQLKADVDARGGIFEIASGDEDFKKRLSAVVRAWFLRRGQMEQLGNGIQVYRIAPEGVDTSKAGFHPPSGAGIGPYPLTGFWKPTEADLEVAWANWRGALLHRLPQGNSSKDTLGKLPGIIAATKDLRSKRGHIDAANIAKLFGFNRAELAKLLGVTAESLRVTRDSPAAQPKLRDFERIARILTLNSDDGNFRKWLHSPNTELAQKTPIEVIRSRGPGVVAALVEDILTNREG